MSESPAQVIASDDILLSELLLGLPVKSLLKFKCVCKRWLSLISDPRFSRRKYLKSNAISALYVDCYSWDSERYYEVVPLDASHTRASFKFLKFPGHPHGIEILQSCKGLLCCRSIWEEDKYFVYNPSTKQFTLLPPVPASPSAGASRVFGVNLAFDPSESHLYNVVCVQGSRSINGCQVLIYSSETRRWRLSGAQFTASLSMDYQDGVYWNGSIHWFGWKDASPYFDMNKELVGEIPMPPLHPGMRERMITWFGESGGHLHLVDFFLNTRRQFNVYEMERDRSGWFVKFQVNPRVLAESYPYIDPFRVLYVVRGEIEADSFLVLHQYGKVIRYNFITQTYCEICDTDSRELHGRPCAFQYIESLCLV